MRKFNQQFCGLSVSFVALLAGAAPAFAEDRQPAANDIAEIIVTAQKRPERLQEIPVAASVMSAASVAQQHVTDLSDINRVVPSVQIKGTFNGRVPYGIRGISTNANQGAIGLTSGVSIQVDGVPVPADSFAANTITDVAQLEVLKGPQATLGGRTASAGVINFVTFAPTNTAQYAFDATATEDGEYRFNGRASGPISDTLTYSATGYYAHTPYPIDNLARGVRSYAESYGARGKLRFEPGTDFDVTLMGHYALSKSTGQNFVPKYLTPGASIFPFFPYSFDASGTPTAFGISQALAFPGVSIGWGNTKVASPVAQSSRYEDRDGSLAINYRTGGLTLSSLTSYFKENTNQVQDLFESGVYFWNVLTAINKIPAPPASDTLSQTGYVRQVTQEFKLATDPARPVNLLAGAFFSDTRVSQFVYNDWVGNPLSKTNVSTTTNYSIYGRVTGKLSDVFTLVGGLRYNHDKIGWNVNEMFDPSRAYFYNCTPSNADGSASGPPSGCTWAPSSRADTLVGDLALQARFNSEVMGYATYTRGYKPAAYNTAHDFKSNQSGPINSSAAAATAYAVDLASFGTPTKKETIDSFELGLKTTLLDRHLTLNLATFYTNYQNYQAQVFDNTRLVGILVLSNAGARAIGLEADAVYRRGDTSLSLSGAYIDAKFRHFAGASCYPTQTAATGCVGGAQDLSGRTLPDSPKFKVSATATQTVPLSRFDVILGSNLSYRSSSVLQANQNPQTFQPAFALLDASIGFQTKDKVATLTFFANNLTNHFYYTNMEDFFSGVTGVATTTSFAPGNYVVGQPARNSHRYFGARLAVSF